MNIPFTKKQFETLVKLVHLGNFMVNSFRPESKRLAEYDDLEQYVLSHAKEAGLERRVAKDDRHHLLHLSETLEDETHQHSKRYDDDIFWDTLVRRMAERDFREQHGKAELADMDDDDYFAALSEIEEKYEAEFDTKGVGRLRLDEGAGD